MRFWLCASALAVGLAGAAVEVGVEAQAPAASRANELTLAGLRPGKDTLSRAEKRYKPKYRIPKKDTENLKVWWDACAGRSLELEVDHKGVIQSITVSSLAPRLGDCVFSPGYDFNRGSQKVWITGRGLALGQNKQRVLALYGEPTSVVPSTAGDREFELLFYAFDWAGSDVPQVMEVTLERESGLVRQITLAFPSL